jgi:hypothetical protein
MDTSPVPSADAATLDPPPSSVLDDPRVERGLWLQGCLVLEACTKGAKPFVGCVMKRLHTLVLQHVKESIARELGAAEDMDWDCATCVDEADTNFTEDGPTALHVSAMDENGVIHCESAHHIKPHALATCFLQNTPTKFFTGPSTLSHSTNLFICRNPADAEDSKDTKSTSFLLLLKIDFDSTTSYLVPFRVERCEPSGCKLEFYAVLCKSRPGLTAVLVNHFLSKTPVPESKFMISDDRSPSTQFRFWSLKKGNSNFDQINHGLKVGHILRFHGSKDSVLPPGVAHGCRYIVTQIETYSFDVCLIICPSEPLTAEAGFVVVRRSPVCRCKRLTRGNATNCDSVFAVFEYSLQHAQGHS